MLFSKSVTPRQVDLALLALRVGAGLSMAAHGYQKVFTYGFSGVAKSFEGMGIPMASVAGPAVAVLELAGGILLALGLLTRPIALLLVFDMIGAMAFAHIQNGFFAPKGVELTLLFAVSFLALAIAGAGSYSVDGALGDRNRR